MARRAHVQQLRTALLAAGLRSVTTIVPRGRRLDVQVCGLPLLTCRSTVGADALVAGVQAAMATWRRGRDPRLVREAWTSRTLWG